VYRDTGVSEVECPTRSIYSGDPRLDRLTASYFHLILSYNENTHSIFPNLWSHSLFPRFRGSAQLPGFLGPGSIISCHLHLTLGGLIVEGPWGDNFAAWPIALQSRCNREPKRRSEGIMQLDVWSWRWARSNLAVVCIWRLWPRVSILKEVFRPDGNVFSWCLYGPEPGRGLDLYPMTALLA